MPCSPHKGAIDGALMFKSSEPSSSVYNVPQLDKGLGSAHKLLVEVSFREFSKRVGQGYRVGAWNQVHLYILTIC